MRINTLFLCLAGLVPAVALSGDTPKAAGGICVPCLVRDTIPSEVIQQEAKRAVDSLKTVKLAELASAQAKQDSLAVQLGLMQHFRNKKLVLYSTDTSNGVVYRAYYWQYKNGKVEPYRTITERVNF